MQVLGENLLKPFSVSLFKNREVFSAACGEVQTRCFCGRASDSNPYDFREECTALPQ